MRKVLTIAVAALMVVAIAGAASAVATSETNWRFTVTADDGTGGAFGPAMNIGIHPTSLDGLDTVAPLQDLANSFIEPPPLPGQPAGVSRWISGVIAGQADVYTKDIKSPTSPYEYQWNHKIWDLRVIANTAATDAPIRLVFKTLGATGTSPTVGGLPIFFELKMINNRGVAGAPANGTKWNIPIPNAASGTVFWSMDTALDRNGVQWGNLPILKSSSSLNAGIMKAEGYEMQFRVVPEPSSMLAMGSGLIGLVGFAIRRRRA